MTLPDNMVELLKLTNTPQHIKELKEVYAKYDKLESKEGYVICGAINFLTASLNYYQLEINQNN